MEEKEVYQELQSIRNLMERSTKFISLSGISGALAGIYALAGVYFGYLYLQRTAPGRTYDATFFYDKERLWALGFVALLVLLLSIVTCVWLSIRQCKRRGESYWNPVSRRLLGGILPPLLSGGLLIIILVVKAYLILVIPVSLIFYGLAILVAGDYTFKMIKGLGYCQILLGLLAVILPEFSVVLWAVGFGVLHILYGSVMHFRFNQ